MPGGGVIVTPVELREFTPPKKMRMDGVPVRVTDGAVMVVEAVVAY
jgi:hypothetical protein